MFDNETRRLVTIFQDVFNLGDCEPDQAKYVKRHAGFIETTGQLFEYLSLAELEHVPPELNRQDSHGVLDRRFYRH